MALQLALISFEFNKIEDIYYNPQLDHPFEQDDPLPGEALQPIIAEAVIRIKRSMAASISSMFAFGQLKIINMSNFLHLATMTFDAQIILPDNTHASTCIIAVAKFYLLEPQITYKCTLDIEEIPSSATNTNSEYAFQDGMSNEQIEKLVCLLNEEFKLCHQIEYMPLIKRGRLEKPHFLISSDERLMEYDFDKLLYSKRSDYQDIKIVSSPTLGNTLLLDNLQNLAEIDFPYTYTLMDRGNFSYKNKEILILGGGDGALLYELLKEEPKFVTMAEIDPMVIDACKEHMRPFGKILESLQGTNYEIIIDDCMKILRKSVKDGKTYDVIFNDLTDIPVTKRSESLTAFDSSISQKDNPWHFIEAIFNLSMACLDQEGVYMNHATGKGNKQTLKAYDDFLTRSRVEVEWSTREAYVPSFMECWVFYTIKKRKVSQQFKFSQESSGLKVGPQTE